MTYMKELSVSSFKARCLAVLDEVARTGVGVTVSKRGRPLARVLPPVSTEGGYPQARLAGTVEILGDVMSPALPAEAWDAEAPKTEQNQAVKARRRSVKQ